MKKYLLISFLLLSILVRADYSTTYLPQLISRSDLILQIKITKVFDEEIEALIIEKIKGEYNSKTIRIQKFKNWTCASRYSDYEIGQEELVFIIQDSLSWHFIGAGNEGEIPIINNKIHYFSTSYYLREDVLDLKEYNGDTFNISTVNQGLKSFLRDKKEISELVKNRKITDFFPNNKFYLLIINEYIFNYSDWSFSEEDRNTRLMNIKFRDKKEDLNFFSEVKRKTENNNQIKVETIAEPKNNSNLFPYIFAGIITLILLLYYFFKRKNQI